MHAMSVVCMVIPSQLVEISPTVLTAILSVTFTTATHAQKHIFGERESSGESVTLFFSCPARYIAQDRGIMDSRQCRQLIPFE